MEHAPIASSSLALNSRKPREMKAPRRGSRAVGVSPDQRLGVIVAEHGEVPRSRRGADRNDPLS
jgi:hypothetical protein